MNAETLFDAITLIDSDLIEEAGEFVPRKKQPVPWKRWAALAACLVLTVGAGLYTLPQLLSCGGSAPENGSGNPGSNVGAGGSGSSGGSTFMSYAGPILPLTALDGAEGITAEREITLDFLPWVSIWWSNEEEAASRTDLTEEERQEVLANYNQWYPEGGRYLSSSDILVTDSYTLTNSTQEIKTVTVLYPFIGALYDLDGDTPVLTAGGETLETTAHAGGYSGGFQGADGGAGEQFLNLDQLNSWEEYKVLLSDGRYQEQALEDYPDLSDTPVIVYQFSDYYGPEPDSRAGWPNPSIRVGFDLDYSKTTVLSYGFHGASWDREGGTMIQEFSIPRPNNPWYGEPYYLFVVGEDIQNLTVGGYVTGGTDPNTKTLDGCGVTVERYETDLESALRAAAELMYGGQSREDVYGEVHSPDFEMYFGLMKEFLLSYGALSEDGVARYDTGWLEFMDFANVDRVFYLEAQVTVPAGESVEVTARMSKPASYDFYGARRGNQGVYGYDLVTRLGSALTFTGQTATLEDRGVIEIVRQNFGFDLEQGVNTVELDPETEHYYLEVHRRPAVPES